MKYLGVYQRYVKIPQCGHIEDGLEYITFYAKKNIASLAICSSSRESLISEFECPKRMFFFYHADFLTQKSFA